MPSEFRINADDFGRSSEVNRAVVRAFREGILTSASLMASGDAFNEAVELTAENEGLQVGIHLVTVMGRSILPHGEIPHITDKLGRFPDNAAVAGLNYFFSVKARQELSRELEAQFEKFLASGLVPSHVDSHLHMHIHPVIFQIALSLAKRHGVRHMRVPRDDFWLALGFGRANLLRNVLEAVVFAVLTRKMRKAITGLSDISCCDRVFGHFLSGRMSEDYVVAILDSYRRGSFEIYFHPALHDEAGGNFSPQMIREASEFRVLTSRKIIESMERLQGAVTRHSHQDFTQ